MKRTFLLILTALAALALFGALVHGVLVIAHLSQPAPTTVHGMTARRLWASAAALLALTGVVMGGLAVARPVSPFPAGGRRRATAALMAGLFGAVIGVLNLAAAKGGPGTGNGVVGAAAALVLGLVAVALGGVALIRVRRATRPGRAEINL